MSLNGQQVGEALGATSTSPLGHGTDGQVKSRQQRTPSQNLASLPIIDQLDQILRMYSKINPDLIKSQL